MHITLSELEAIDTLLSQQLRAGQFETCADPVEYVRTSNRLLDACIDAVGKDYVDDFADAEECAAFIVAKALTTPSFVIDEDAPDYTDDEPSDEFIDYYRQQCGQTVFSGRAF